MIFVLKTLYSIRCLRTHETDRGAPKGFAFYFSFTFPGVVAVSAVEVTPVQKVIELLHGMVDKGKKEKHDEQVQFAAYKQFCDDTSVEKQRAIKEANQQIEKLNADIQK